MCYAIVKVTKHNNISCSLLCPCCRWQQSSVEGSERNFGARNREQFHLEGGTLCVADFML